MFAARQSHGLVLYIIVSIKPYTSVVSTSIITIFQVRKLRLRKAS